MKFGSTTQYPWFMLASIYVTQYIGIAFILSAAVAILRQQGVALDKLALLNLAVLPLMGKVFYAPLIDKYRLSLQGKYRSWLIIAQASMTLLLVIAGAMDFENQFTWIIVILTFYVFSLSVQDVAIDGLSCKLFAPDARKLASSVQFSGNLLGNIIGGGLILMFYPWLEWHGSLWLLAALTSISLIQMVLFNEPEESMDNQPQQEEHKHLLRGIKDFIKQNKHWFVIMALYPIGSTCGFALLTPLLVDGGWQFGDIGFVMKIFGSAVGLISALLATPLISRIGQVNALISALFVQVFALALIIPLTLGFTEKPMVYAAITVHFISFPALLVISSTIIMDKAAQTIHKATFFTLQFSFASLLGFAYSAISMTIAKHIGYSTVVIAGVVLTLGIALFICFLLKRKSIISIPIHNVIPKH
ncbi:MFS transporter [Marinomonas colpomeniae]|uniref:MFS transporter n=1 Tax=Marinomonas colpomeniae TaxID=2774408 RepID=A0ABR8P206_9GAMM|nr:MFS transporter [Marinomonas colpomeniae]MBD5770797.1 MFS transporter [Marinomonas colpomeniae]